MVQMMAIHTISLPSEIRHPVLAADTFVWRNRETVAVVSGKSLWIGWRRDIHCERVRVREGEREEATDPQHSEN